MFEDVMRHLKKLERGISVPISLPLDEKGYLDRECPSENCRADFKVLFEDWREKVRDEVVFCPLCRCEAPSGEWNTTEQAEYMGTVAKAHVLKELSRCFESDASRFNRSQPRGGFIQMKMSFKPSSLPSPFPIESLDAMQQDFACESCGCRYSSLGAAFFCPACGHNSAISTFETTLTTVEKTLASLPRIRESVSAAAGADTATNTVREILEGSIERLVGSFQRYAEALFQQLPNACEFKPRKNLFQRIDESSELWDKACGTRYEDILNPGELKDLRRLFQQRHVLTHKAGIIDQEYVERSQDTTYSVGQRLVIKEESALYLVALVRKLAAGLPNANQPGKSSPGPQKEWSTPRISPMEQEILQAASGDGNIVLIATDQVGTWVRAGNRNFVDEDNPAVAARYRDALDGLRRLGFVKQESDGHFTLTGKAWEIADLRKMDGSSPTTADCLEERS